MNWKRQVNAEEAVLPLRSVVMILVVVITVSASAIGLAIMGTQQWDAVKGDVAALKRAVETFNATVKDRAAVRDKQIADVNTRIDDLTRSVDQLAQAQDSAHADTVGAIADIRLQISNITKDIAVMKCHIPGNPCQRPK